MFLFSISIAFISGGILGLIYFGGLWWTVDRLKESQSPLALYLASFIARLTLVAICTVLILQVSTLLLVAATSGFLVVRIFLVTRTAYAFPTPAPKAE